MLYEFIKNIHFAYPWSFLLLALLPFLHWYYFKKSDSQQPDIRFSTIQSLKVTSWKIRFRHLPFVLRLLSIVCLIMVLARPQKLISNQRSVGEGIDIMLCMDVSGSMGSQDIPPSRMEVAKEVAATFVRSRPVDRIGLVIFSGESFTQCPLTGDKESLISQIENLESRTLLKDGTVIGEGLATAVDRICKSTAKSKIIILITDGKEDAPDTRLIDPLTALEIAKAKKIKVYTIGMGALPTTIVEVKGRKPQQQAAFDFIDENLLKKIASETGGQYFRARDKQGLQETYTSIDNLEKSKVEIEIQKRAEEKYLPFILAALFFLFVELIFRFTVFKRFP
ncbi:MAG TPA: VWA domain-containing protein [Chitinophagaceae bacterium]|jgi:Ca-activated chloride channel family protein|nr:VWA domain-containing protein [Chitinophagaceae bacterium]